MKKLKAFWKGEKAPKEKRYRREVIGRNSTFGPSSSQLDSFKPDTPLRAQNISEGSTSSLNLISHPFSSQLSTPVPASTSQVSARQTGPTRQGYNTLPGQIASFSPPAPAATSQPASTTRGRYESWPGGRTERMSAVETQSRVPPQRKPVPGGPTTTTAATAAKKDGAEESDSDDSDMDDLMAMMIAASLVSRSEGEGGGSGSSDGLPGLETLLLGAMLAKARQKREAENKSGEGKKEEQEEKTPGGGLPSQAQRDWPSRTGASQVESFAEWRARRAREREREEKLREEKESAETARLKREQNQRGDRRISEPLPLSVNRQQLQRVQRERREREEREEREKQKEREGKDAKSTNSLGTTPTSTPNEAEKTQVPRRSTPGPQFKVRPLAKETAPPIPAPKSMDRRTGEGLQKESSKPARVERETVGQTPTPAPTPYKRVGPKFKVPPRSTA